MAQAIDEDAEKLITELEKCRTKYFTAFDKQAAKLQTWVSELVDEPMEEYNKKVEAGESPDKPTLMVIAQYSIEKDLDNIKSMLDCLTKEHKTYHKLISRCGRSLDKNFEPNLSGLIKNEKDLEDNVDNKQKINQMMYDFFLEKGMSDVASTLEKEAEFPIERSKERSNQEIDIIMGHFRNQNLIPVMEFLEQQEDSKDSEECRDLLFQLYIQQMILMVTKGNKYDIIEFGKKLQSFGEGYAKEISHVMGAIMGYPEILPRHADLFHPNTWQVLESKLIKFISRADSPLETLLKVGAKSVHPMLAIKSLLGHASLLNSDELPVSINVPNPVHSTFTCPILKTQSSESNPPVRLGCGHVISRDAVSKLASARPPARSARPARHNNRMKCPYCPEEINTHENKRLYFN